MFSCFYAKEKEIQTTPPYPCRISFSHHEGRGIGYKEGYSSLGVLLTKNHCQDHISFLNARGHLFNNGKFASNFGAGLRYYLDEKKTLLGTNIFYDYRRAVDHNFHQGGIGIELGQEKWQFSTNAYVPFGKSKKLLSNTFDHFAENNLYFNENAKLHMWGVDANIEGKVLKRKDIALLLGGGPYYFKDKFGEEAIGAKFYTEAYFLKYVYVKVEGFYDKVFNNHINGEIGLSGTFGKHSKRTPKKSSSVCYASKNLRKLLDRPPRRQEIIVLSDQKRLRTAQSLDSHNPINIIHNNNVNWSATSIGSGTYEDPYVNLSDAQSNSSQGDVIYVNYGNGSLAGRQSGITLKDRQQLLGSGVTHTINTRAGKIVIPALSTNPPSITNTSTTINNQAGVVLADNNVVEGLLITGTQGNGIEGIHITQGSKITDNSIIDTGLTVGTNAGIEIVIKPGQTISGTMKILRNTISSTNRGNDGIYIHDDATTFLTSGNYNIDVQIEDNLIQANTSEGLFIQRLYENSIDQTLQSFTVTGTIKNNNINGNAGDGIAINYNTGITEPMLLDLIISDNTLTGNNDEGLGINLAKGNLEITNNFSGRNTDKGFEILTSSDNTLTLKFNDNRAAYNGDIDGLLLYSLDSAVVTAEFYNNFAESYDSSLPSKFYFYAGGTSSQTIKMGHNQGRINALGYVYLDDD